VRSQIRFPQGLVAQGGAARCDQSAIPPDPAGEAPGAGSQNGRDHLKARLVKAGLKENRCEICGIDSWLDRPLNTQLHHLNGDGTDNRLENLQFLCPNCHSQTDTYGGRNGHRRKGHLRLVAAPENDREDVA
jgi:hypothetical protein